MLKAYEKAKSNDDSLHNTLLTTRSQLLTIEQQYSGSKTRSEVGEKNEYPTMNNYIWAASGYSATYGPTQAHLKYLSIAQKLLNDLTNQLNTIQETINPLAEKLKAIGAPEVQK